jgi:hypothetical protein
MLSAAALLAALPGTFLLLLLARLLLAALLLATLLLATLLLLAWLLVRVVLILVVLIHPVSFQHFTSKTHFKEPAHKNNARLRHSFRPLHAVQIMEPQAAIRVPSGS